MALGYYIEGERLDLFDDENIVISSSVQNINDISKVFSDFSQSITFPASKKNNIIFKHFNNPDIVNGFDHRTFKNSYIEIDTIPFKVGKTRLESVSVKNGKPEHYKCTFFGLLVSLKDRFKDDYISGLDFSSYNHSYDSANVLTGLTTGLFSGNIIYPLISSLKRWYYNSDTADTTNTDEIVNIDYVSGQNKGVKWSELKPAIKVMRIIEAIETKYGITFSRDFIGTSLFDNLYLWMSIEKGEIKSVGALNKSLVNWDSVTGSTKFIDLSTDFWNGLTSGNIVVSYHFTIKPEAGYETIPYNFYFIDTYKNDEIILSGTDLTGTTIRTGQLPSVYAENLYNIGIYVSSNVIFSYTTNIIITEDNISMATTSEVGTYGSSVLTLTSEMHASAFMPKIKVIDFFNGIINAYNQAVLPNSETDFFMDTLDSWYLAGNTYDISQYIDRTKSIPIERGKILKEINFKFQEAKTFLSEQYKGFNNTSYGDLELSLEDEDGKPLDGDTLKIELPFEQMIYGRLTDQNDGVKTNIQMGYAVDDKQEPTATKPHIFYAINQSTVGKTFSFIDSSSTVNEITGGFMPFHGNLNTLADYTTLWGADLNEWDGTALNNSLFNNYYMDYISDIFSVKRRVYNYKSRLPAWLMGKIKLNDKLIIDGTRYIINKMDSNLTTKEVSFELLNDIY